ncbi:hypothetical protein ACX40Y_05430 [Sphingomonas sp. RS6]
MTPLALLAVALVLAPPGAAQDHAARVDRLIAALPKESGEGEPVVEPDDETLVAQRDALVADHPDQKPVIVDAFAAQARCSNDTARQLAADGMRNAIERLTDDEIEQLTVFYTGPDYQRLAAGASDGEMAALAKRYPLERFSAVMGEAMPAMFSKAMDAFSACESARNETLARAGIKD